MLTLRAHRARGSARRPEILNRSNSNDVIKLSVGSCYESTRKWQLPMNNIYYPLTFTLTETHQAYLTALLSVCNNMLFFDQNDNREKQVSFSSRQWKRQTLICIRTCLTWIWITTAFQSSKAIYRGIKTPLNQLNISFSVWIEFEWNFQYLTSAPIFGGSCFYSLVCSETSPSR